MACASVVEEITECSICAEVYTDPRMLPCGHTFCLKCVETYAKDKQPGDKLPCPLCRKNLLIPADGMTELPPNYFVNKLLQLKVITGYQSHRANVCCDLCCDDVSSLKGKGPAAVTYCVECQEKLCVTCVSIHKRQKICRSHRTITIGEKIMVEDICESFPPPPCKTHPDDMLRFYCLDCRDIICMSCFVDKHSAHKCSDVHALKNDFQTQLAEDVSSIDAGLEKCSLLLEKIVKEKQEFSDQGTKTEVEIAKHAEQLKISLDQSRDKLIEELCQARKVRFENLETVEGNVKKQIGLMKGFKVYASELKEKGSVYEVAQEVKSLRKKSKELLQMEQVGQATANLRHVDIVLNPSLFGKDGRNLIGEICVLNDYEEVKPMTPTVTFSESKSSAIMGITVYESEIYISRQNLAEIEVYSAENLSLIRKIPVPVSGAQGLASCSWNVCLYLSDYDSHRVFRVALMEPHTVMKWTVANNPYGLSINTARNVLVACCGTNKIQEFTTFGILVREITLQDNLSLPMHAIQMTSGEYVLSHAQPYQSVSVIGVDGKLVRTYGNTQKFGAGAMSVVQNIAVCKNGSVLVGDTNLHRVLIVNSTLTAAHEIPVQLAAGNATGIYSPRCLYLDELRNRLYVGEASTYYRLVVFEHVRNTDIDAGVLLL